MREPSMALDTRRTTFGAACAVATWLAVVLIVIQIGYSLDLYWLLRRDFELLIIAIAGLSATLLAIFCRSAASHPAKLGIGAASLGAFLGLAFFGVLFVACSNGNCL